MTKIDEFTNHELDTGIVRYRNIKPTKNIKSLNHLKKVNKIKKLRTLAFLRRQKMRKHLRQIESKLNEAMQCVEV